MYSEDVIHIEPSESVKIKEKIPSEDLINSQFDKDYGVSVTDVLVIFSTPRSGSTVFCDLIRQNKGCIPHEYFQSQQYIPILAERWNCIEASCLKKDDFIRSLCKYRTYQNGFLGINLHGLHLNNFLKLENIFKTVRWHYIHMMRSDVIGQAVSFAIASQTGQWSSHYKKQKEAGYDFMQILSKLDHINKYNALIKAFLTSRNVPWQTVYYEDFCADPETVLSNLPCFKEDISLKVESSLSKQVSPEKEKWVHQFAHELLNRHTKVVFPSAHETAKQMMMKKILSGLSSLSGDLKN